MNLFQILIGLVILGSAVAIARHIRKSGASAFSTTNLLLIGIVGLLGFFAYQQVQSENREAIRTVDYDRCWTDSCKSSVTDRLVGTGGAGETLTDANVLHEVEMDFSNSLNQSE